LITVHDEATGRAVLTLKHEVERGACVAAVAFGPKSNLLDSAGANNIMIWDITTGKAVTGMKGPPGTILCLDYCPDGDRIATGWADGAVTIWDTVTGQVLLTLEGHSGPVNRVIFSSDGRRLVGGGEDGTVRLWNAAP
jgi:WD40 repeat protein